MVKQKILEKGIHFNKNFRQICQNYQSALIISKIRKESDLKTTRILIIIVIIKFLDCSNLQFLTPSWRNNHLGFAQERVPLKQSSVDVDLTLLFVVSRLFFSLCQHLTKSTVNALNCLNLRSKNLVGVVF